MSRCSCIAVSTQFQCQRKSLPNNIFCNQHLKKCTKKINNTSSPRQKTPQENLEPNLQKTTIIDSSKSTVSSLSPKIQADTKLSSQPKESKNIVSSLSPKIPADKKLLSRSNPTFLCPSTEKIKALNISTLTDTKVIRKYGKLGTNLGSGAYGTVMQVGDNYALKKMEDKDFDGVSSSAIREISTYVYLGSFPNIVSIYNADVNIETETVDLLLELADHGSLHHFYDSKDMPKVNSLEFKSLVYQLVRGAAYMNMLDVIHRDIKPQNVLIFNTKCNNNPNNLNYILKIADFGLAISNVCGLGLSLANPVYTLWYRSPEILLGSRHYDDKSDAWAIAATIYEMVAKDILFPGSDELDELVVIASVLGPPTGNDWANIVYDYEMERKMKRRIKSIKFDPSLYPTLYPTDPSFNLLSDLIHKGLIYDPEKRWNTVEMLHHPYFDEIRDIVENDINFKCLQSPITIADLPCKQKKCLVRKYYAETVLSIDQINNITKIMAKHEGGILDKTGHTALYIYFDYLKNDKSVDKDSYLIATASYLIASKLVNTYPVSVGALTNYDINIYSSHIFNMERNILKTLAWNLYVSTSYDFMTEYIKTIKDQSTLPTKLIDELSKLTTKYLMKAVPLGFTYLPDFIALVCLKKAILDLELKEIDTMFFNHSLNNELLHVIHMI